MRKELLEKDDIDVAEDGEKALILAVHKYDVIFMDINLPKMNGIDVVKEIRTNSSYKSNKSKIIGLTAFCDEKIHNLCFEVGFDAVEVKPINTDKLRKYI